MFGQSFHLDPWSSVIWLTLIPRDCTVEDSLQKNLHCICKMRLNFLALQIQMQGDMQCYLPRICRMWCKFFCSDLHGVEMEVSLPNPWRQKAQGKIICHVLITLYSNNTSGNNSKQWNKHILFYFTLAGLHPHLTNQDYHFIICLDAYSALIANILMNFVKISQCIGHRRPFWLW
jgi:hypothetical protein